MQVQHDEKHDAAASEDFQGVYRDLHAEVLRAARQQLKAAMDPNQPGVKLTGQLLSSCVGLLKAAKLPEGAARAGGGGPGGGLGLERMSKAQRWEFLDRLKELVVALDAAEEAEGKKSASPEAGGRAGASS